MSEIDAKYLSNDSVTHAFGPYFAAMIILETTV